MRATKKRPKRPAKTPVLRASYTRGGAMKCRVCDCTQERGCDVGCGWAAEGLCTVCADLQDKILVFCKASLPPPLLSRIVAGLHEHVVDGLGDGDDLRSRRAVFDLLACGFTTRDRERGYSLTEMGEKRARSSKRRGTGAAA
jgi:hypothetical protein